MINSIINKVEEGMKHHLTDKGIEKLRITLRYALSDFVIKEAETSAEDVQTTNEQLIQGFALAKMEVKNMMITKETFVSMITTICTAIDESRWLCENCNRLNDNDKKDLMEGCDYQKDLITMLTCITIDRFGVIRDYLYDRDEDGEYFLPCL